MGFLIPALLATAACLMLWPAAGVLRCWALRLAGARQEAVERELPGLFLFVDSRRYAWLVAALVLACTSIAVGASGSALAGACAGLAALAAPRLVATRMRARRLRRIRAQLPEAAELLGASLRAGLGLAQSLAHLARHAANPLAQELQLVLREHRMGRNLDAALGALRERIGGEGVGLLVAAMGSGQRLGGNLSDVLARVAQTLRDRQAIEMKIDALTSQGRLQARIVAMLPVMLLVVMTRLQPRAMHLMYSSTQGWMVLAVIALLESGGLLLLRRIARVDV